MARFRLAIIICTLSFLFLSGCDLLPQQKYKPSIPAIPSASESGIMWGGDKAKIVATIDSVVIECIPVEKPKDNSSKFKSSIVTEYEIAATANVSYNIMDRAFFKNATMFSNFESKIIFEALTASGVVIGQDEGTVRIIENGTSTKASAKIYGLTLDEVKKVVRVEARWKYGK